MKNIILAILLLFPLSYYGQNIIQSTIQVDGVCGMCQTRIETAAIEGGKADEASWDIDTKLLTVFFDGDKTSSDAIQKAISKVGHDTEKYKASDASYNKLHGCCKYRDKDVIDAHKPELSLESDPFERTVAEGFIEGYISSLGDKDDTTPLIGANIIDVATGKGTSTDENGYFKIPLSSENMRIKISYIGYKDQEMEVNNSGFLDIQLDEGNTLEEVTITYRQKASEISFLETLQVENISQKELFKAACCNLSESFETNPSVDISYADAITGTKQIQMLGLAGPYVQITRELLPDVRGLNTVNGLDLTPGSWIKSIQMVKGAGSVANGFESLTGQINVELVKPEDESERLFLNGYLNNGGRMELNLRTRAKLSEHVSTGLLLHGELMNVAHDRNDDGFLDNPLKKDFILINRWKLTSHSGLRSQIGLKVANLKSESGSHDHFHGSEEHWKHWQMNGDTEQYELWGKIGYLNEDNPQHSVGLQWSLNRMEHRFQFGQRNYNGAQRSLFAKLTYQNTIDPSNIFRAGVSYQLDDIIERLSKSIWTGLHRPLYERYESVPGVFAEYTWQNENKWSIIPGLRLDHHNNYGLFWTPRLHAKYHFDDDFVVRIGGGRSLRTANILAENMGIFSSSRAIDIMGHNDDPYGLKPEIAWNYGVSLSKNFTINQRTFGLHADVYRSVFESQIVLDLERAQFARFYNLDGSSYSNSFQIRLDGELSSNFDVRLAYRLFDVKTTYGGELKERPLVSKHRAFVNFGYEIPKSWLFDLTANWVGAKRLPVTTTNPSAYQRPDYSPDYFLLNAQVTKNFGENFAFYLGGENLTNYKQKDAIISGDDPFGEYFDASIVWAPLFGINVYAGFRYTLR